jgi:hypothetical protein
VSDLLSAFKWDDAPSKRWLEQHLDHQDREFCLIWPLSRAQNGYPTCGANNAIRPHRIMCERRHGPPPSPAHQAAHSCGKGHLGCVNPWHLNWKTPSENQLERYKQSGLMRRAKLTPEQVDEIRGLKGRARTVDIAQQFGVTEANIRQIQSGKTWTAESNRQRPLTAEEVIEIRRKPYTATAVEAAKRYGVSRSIIEHVRARDTYRWVVEPAASLVQPSHQLGTENG